MFASSSITSSGFRVRPVEYFKRVKNRDRKRSRRRTVLQILVDIGDPLLFRSGDIQENNNVRQYPFWFLRIITREKRELQSPRKQVRARVVSIPLFAIFAGVSSRGGGTYDARGVRDDTMCMGRTRVGKNKRT